MYKIIVSHIPDPYFNLALENKILIETKSGERTLLIYINQPCVVIGRFQNPWLECHITKMAQKNVYLVRRQSGGGTVYHDQHNVNFSFITDRKLHDQTLNHKIVVLALEKLNIPSIATKRGDIILDDGTKRKISGSAFKQKKEQAFHHGTMLINSDLKKLNEYIHSSQLFQDAKGIKSTRSQVANISEFNSKITNEAFIDALIASFKHQFTNCYIEHMNMVPPNFEVEYQSHLKSYAWKMLETPQFSIDEKIQFDETDLQIQMVVKKGMIVFIELSSTDESPILLNQIVEGIKNTEISIAAITNQFKKLEYLDDKKIRKIRDWFIDYFELIYVEKI